ncbi:Major ampullate spidroin 1 [Nitrospirillum viridazoti Y2]|nr:Major ampullate spidroin 1 [Nitrospirillum amazonense Y2]
MSVRVRTAPLLTTVLAPTLMASSTTCRPPANTRLEDVLAMAPPVRVPMVNVSPITTRSRADRLAMVPLMVPALKMVPRVPPALLYKA